ncbi:hypothetical protein RhiirA4_479378 [Rhizophagus irregularis]|uniref:HAT C-terminal dimerisation domain-containing protein n=1 Tax=Rhizophagus irregularis TaxID=588596 RepID=A0A2I1HGI4_9GLOM|nr:hypothetical protein RhiirA4_479378 [Rhizophagus irregularis]
MAFEVAYNKFIAHIPNHPSQPLFNACQVFNPKYIHAGDLLRKNIRQYSVIKEFTNPFCSVERSFSMYNSLLNNDRQNLSKDSLKRLITFTKAEIEARLSITAKFYILNNGQANLAKYILLSFFCPSSSVSFQLSPFPLVSNKSLTFTSLAFGTSFHFLDV